MSRPSLIRVLSLPIALPIAVLLLGACATPEPVVDKVSARPIEPARGEQVAVDQVLIVIDSSGSLDDGDMFYHARALAESFVASSPEGDYEAGAVAFGGFDRHEIAMTRFDRASLQSQTAQTPHLESGTPIHKVLAESKTTLASGRGRAAVVIISDGEFTDEFGREVEVERIVAAATELDSSYDGTVCFHTVQVGESQVGAEMLRRVSEVTACGSTRSQAALGNEAQLHALERDVFIQAASVAAQPAVLPPVSAPAPTPVAAAPATSWSLNFGYDSAAVSSMYDGQLRAVADRVEASPTARVEVSGHTDSKGDAEYNRKLSMRRAEATREALVEAGVASDRIVIKGFGEDSLLGPDEGDENSAAANRRTDIEIVD